MTCEEAVKKLYEYIDKELDRSTVEQLDRHLEICKSCCDHFEFERKVKALIQDSVFVQKAPISLKDRIQTNLKSLE